MQEGVPGGIRADFNRDVVCLFGIAFDRVTLPQAEAHVRKAIHKGQRCHIATPNVNLMRIARSDHVFRTALLGADLTLVDGMPLVWLARLQGIGLTVRVAGSDLFAALGRDGTHSIRTFFFGGTEAVCGELRRKLSDKVAGVRCVGTLAPGFGSAEDMSRTAIIDQINAAAPDLVAVAVSARKGLDWIKRNETALAAPVLANLGATIHFEAGTVIRAPVAWSRAGFEWLWRIRQEPWLWRRYGADFATLVAITVRHVVPALAWRLLPFGNSALRDQSRVQILSHDEGKTIQLSGVFQQDDLHALREAFASATRLPEALTLNLDGVRSLDAAALGLLLLAYGHQHRIGQPITVEANGRRIRTLLRIKGCGFLLAAGPTGSNAPTGWAQASKPIPALSPLRGGWL